MYRIKEFASLCNCSVYTLRYYDQIGLLKPTVVAHESGYRYYAKEQIQDYMRIKELQEIGFQVQEIKEMIEFDEYQIVCCILKKIDVLQHRFEKSIQIMSRYMEEGRKESRLVISKTIGGEIE